MGWVSRWKGGRVKRGREGQGIWVIEQMRAGRRYSISLSVRNEEEALEEFAWFRRNPVEYQARHDAQHVGSTVTEGPTICAETITAYQEDCRHGEHPVTDRHLRDTVRYLMAWMDVLGGKDLRKVPLREYRAALRKIAGKAAVRPYAAALRSFTHWMRRDGRLSSAEDASRDLEIPQTRARRAQRQVSYPMEDFKRLYTAVSVPAVRAVLALRALCGTHHTEIERLARGDWKVRVLEGQGEIAGTVIFLHKKGLAHPQSLSHRAMEAALYLQRRGYAPAYGTVADALVKAAREVGLPRLLPGALRHCFVTWAVTHGREVKPVQGAGVPLETIARVVGHTTVATTAIYDGTEIPPLIALPLVLGPIDP